MTNQPEESKEKLATENKIRKVTWNSKFRWTSLKIGIVIFWQRFPSAKPKELLREEKDDSLMLATIRDDTWNVKCALHTAHNAKFEKMGLFRHPRGWPLIDERTRPPVATAFENFEILNTASIWPQIFEKIVSNYATKSIFTMMTSSMTSQGGLKVGPLYSFINEITTFFMITKKRDEITII